MYFLYAHSLPAFVSHADVITQGSRYLPITSANSQFRGAPLFCITELHAVTDRTLDEQSWNASGAGAAVGLIPSSAPYYIYRMNILRLVYRYKSFLLPVFDFAPLR